MDIGNIPPMISNCAVKTDDHVPAKNVVRGTGREFVSIRGTKMRRVLEI